MSRTERLAQPKVFGKYQLISRLAHGRLGDVYKAKVHGLEGFERIVVLKIYEQGHAAVPSFLDILADEAQRVNMLAHANIAQIFNFGIHEEDGVNHPFLVTEHVHGLDLERAVQICHKANIEIPLELTIFVASEIAQGLDYAHRRKDYNFTPLNLMHYDLGPTNVMMSVNGDVKLTDFGTPRAIEALPVLDEQELQRRVLYRAPEAARGESYSQKSDLFSLGLVLYMMLTGEHPYLHGNPSPNEVFERAKKGTVPPITQQRPQLAKPVVRIIDSLLNPDPKARVQSAGQAYEELVSFLYGQNLQNADARSLGLFIQDLRQDERRLFGAGAPAQQPGVQEISIHEIQVPDLHESLISNVGIGHKSEPTIDALPKQKLQHLLSEQSSAESSSATFSALPQALEDHFKEACAGRGKLVILYGELGAGRDYVPDRLTDLLGARGNAEVHDIQAVRDDKVRPLGALGDLLLSLLMQGKEGSPIDSLNALGASEREVQALLGLRKLEDARIEELTPALFLQAIFEVSVKILTERSKHATLILLIDRAAFLDPLSNLIIRRLIPVVAELPCLLMLSNHQLDVLQHQLQTNPQHAKFIESVNVNSSPHPTLRDLDALTGDLREVLIPLGMLQRPMDQSQITRLVGWDSARVFNALKTLVKQGIVRVPSTGIFFAAHADMDNWLKKSSTPELRRHLVDQYMLIHGEDHKLVSVQLLQLQMHVLAGERQQTRHIIERYASWLEFHGQKEILSIFYQNAIDHFSDPVLSAPNLRLEYITRQAELLLERASSARGQIGPMYALAEHMRDEASSIRSKLLQGEVLMKLDDLDEAHEYLQSSFMAAQSTHNAILAIKSRLALATWFDRYGYFARATDMIQGALNLHELWDLANTEQKTYAKTLAWLTHLTARQGNIKLAQTANDTLARFAQATGAPFVMIMHHWSEATCALYKDQVDLSTTHLTRAISLSESYQFKALRIELMRRFTDLALQTGRYNAALETLGELIPMSKESEDVYNFQRAIEMRALAQIMTYPDSQRAMITLEQALNRAQSRNVPKDMLRCHDYLALVHRSAKRPQNAAAHAQHAAKIRQQLGISTAV